MAISTAIDQSAVARVIGVKTNYIDTRGGSTTFLPQRIALLGQGSEAVTYTTTPKQIFSAAEVGTEYGFGSPLHLAAKELFPVNGDSVGIVPVTIYPMDAGAGATESVGTITTSGSQVASATYVFRISGILSAGVTLAAGTSANDAATAIGDAINAVIDMPVIATVATSVVTLTAKWEGVSGDDITVELASGVVDGIAFAIVQPTGGTINPDVTATLAQINSIWETCVINTLQSDDTVLDFYQTWGEGRVDPTVNKTAYVLSGSVDTLANLLTLGGTRKNDRINSVIPVEASPNLPLQIAARAASRITGSANSNPAQDYAGLPLTGIIPGGESTRWTYAQRDSAVNAGISTVEVIDDTPQLSDTVTFYHPDGEVPPAYRYVVDIVKLQNLQYRTQVTFSTNEWRGAPLIGNDDVTNNPTAKKPKDAVAAISVIIRGAGLDALIADVDDALASVQAEISSSNPKRIDASYSVKLSGNVNIVSVDLNFGFFFGGSN